MAMDPKYREERSKMSAYYRLTFTLLAAFAVLCAGASDADAAAVYTAAGPIRGVTTLPPAPPAPSAPPGAYGTRRDFERGYVGNNPEPGDFWHRDNDFKAREYMFKYGPQPEFAAPPAPAARPRPGDVTLPETHEPRLPDQGDAQSRHPGRFKSAPRLSPAERNK
jgi:hypothetical protein